MFNKGMRYSSKKSGPAFGRKARMAQDGNSIRFPRAAENPRFRNLEKADEERRYRQMRNNFRDEREMTGLPLRRVKNPKRKSMKGRKLNENQLF